MENTDSLMGGCSHQEGGEEALQQKLLFPRCRALCGLGGGSTRWTVLQPFGSELHGGMSLTTSADHAFIIEAGGKSVKVKQEGERMQRAESEGGRARLVETLSKVSPAVSG
ncbi:hypothetical protein, partial [Pseudomonas aeruginosa]|uniref:hypothetical protein n=5 Tax=Pseudomonas aeruginosa TaxID=287 RepID=UPI001968B29E